MPLIPEGATVYVVDLHYLVPLERIDALGPGHRAFLAEQYAAGRFLVSGPKTPRTGGVILALAESEAALREVLAQDPFHAEGAAEYRITAFEAKLAAPALR